MTSSRSTLPAPRDQEGTKARSGPIPPRHVRSTVQSRHSTVRVRGVPGVKGREGVRCLPLPLPLPTRDDVRENDPDVA